MAEGAGLLNRKRFFSHFTPRYFSLFHGTILTNTALLRAVWWYNLTSKNGSRYQMRYAMHFAIRFHGGTPETSATKECNGTGKAAVIESGARWRALWRVWTGWNGICSHPSFIFALPVTRFARPIGKNLKHAPKKIPARLLAKLESHFQNNFSRKKRIPHWMRSLSLDSKNRLNGCG